MLSYSIKLDVNKMTYRAKQLLCIRVYLQAKSGTKEDHNVIIPFVMYDEYARKF